MLRNCWIGVKQQTLIQTIFRIYKYLKMVQIIFIKMEREREKKLKQWIANNVGVFFLSPLQWLKMWRRDCFSGILTWKFLYPPSPLGRGGILFYLGSSIQDIFRCNFLSNCWWQKSDIWSQASYRYTILLVAFLDPSDSYFLFADLVGFYTHWTYMHIFLSNYWWQKSDIWSQASI